MNKEYKITELFGSYQLEIDNNKLFYDVDKDIVNIIQTLQQENEKLNHYKLLYQKVKERNDNCIEYNEQIIKDTKGFYRPTEDTIYSGDCLIDIATQNINYLKDNNEVSNEDKRMVE